jgi:hypothetical protein
MTVDIDDGTGLYEAPPCEGLFPKASAILTPALPEILVTKLDGPQGPSFFCSLQEEPMNCWHCETELIWGGDHDVEDNDDFDIETNLTCPKCHSLVFVLWKGGEG